MFLNYPLKWIENGKRIDEPWGLQEPQNQRVPQTGDAKKKNMNVIQGIVPLDLIPGQGTMGTQMAGNTPVSEQKSRSSWDDKVEDYLEATIDASSKMTGECRRQLKEEIRNTEVNKEQQMGNQAPTNIKAKTVENKRVQFQQQRRNTTNTRNTFARLQQDPKVGNKKDDDEEEVNGTQGNMSLSMRNEVTTHVLYNQGKGETLSPMDKLGFWNVRGLNRADRQREVHLFMHTHKVSLFELLETKFKRAKAIKAA
ncbi:hypothetical protein MTR67_044972 [Solanum verrucosum]|uniref:Uncharacterized protein n=1 Tax=Solanum verrucosum TaxID=315347 RepID=A0AAF0ZTB9_SOLVR|nr:hypothetical protein MTR67_044972 [Solanum verrucosum]